jgi:hypothetical protein
MKVFDLTSASAKLDLAMQALDRKKAEAMAQWDDPVSRSFNQRFLVPLEPRFQRAMDAIERLTQILAEAERQCGPRD